MLEDLGVVSHSDIPHQVLSWAFAGNCAWDSGEVMSWIGTFQRFQDLTQSWQALIVTGMLFCQERDDIDFNRHGRRDKTEIQFELSSDKQYTVTTIWASVRRALCFIDDRGICSIVLEAAERKAYRGRLMTCMQERVVALLVFAMSGTENHASQIMRDLWAEMSLKDDGTWLLQYVSKSITRDA